ncbi:MAG: hypothetical protein C5S40_05285 [ANME-2 cluster archaeon]|nr:hypothetical protein [ANME-2 cluster archaeon]
MMNISEKSFEQTIEYMLIAVLPAKEGSISEITPNLHQFHPWHVLDTLVAHIIQGHIRILTPRRLDRGQAHQTPP